MYCVKCGVKLADTERKCPLCGTTAYHPDLDRPAARPLYPERKMPKAGSGRKAVSGLFIFLFLLPTIVGLFSDWQPDGRLDWFGYDFPCVSVGSPISWKILQSKKFVLQFLTIWI